MLGYFNYTTWLTYLGLISGVSGILLAADGKFSLSIVCLLLAGFFDLFDGKVASTKKDRTEDMKKFGIQIDSLSDLVCFCVLPSVFFISLAKRDLPSVSPYAFYPVAVLLVLSGLIRLAYFNVMEEHRQQTEKGLRKMYSGVPVTTTAIAVPLFHGIYSLIYTFTESASQKSALVKGYVWFLMAELLLFAFAFLFKGFKIKKMHGKVMIIPVIVGFLAFLAVLVAGFLHFQ